MIRSTLSILLLLCLYQVRPATGQAQRQRTPAKADQPSGSQSTGPQRYHLGAVARSYGDSIIVRWAPEQALLFKAAVRSGGYRLTRRTVGANEVVDMTVKPWTVEEWKQRANRRDTIAGVCSQLLWGKAEPMPFDQNVNLSGILQQQQQNNFRLMLALLLADEDPRHAAGMGLGYIDKNVQRGKRYVYAISAITDRTVLYSDTARTLITNDGPHPQADMIAIKTEAGDRVAKISWNRALAETQFSAYYVEKSVDGGRTFRRLNKRPWLQAPTGKFAQVYEYTDSLTQNYRPVQYRVIGLTAFGELSQPSPMVSAQGIDRTGPAAVSKLQAVHQSGGRVRLSWQYPKPPGDLAGYVVAKSTDSQGPFQPLTDRLLAPGQREFIDTTAIPSQPAYYVVVPVDTARNAGASLPAYCLFKDTNGPSKPKNLQGYVDSTGFVRLVWDRNPEPDLLGYMVVWANDPSHVFTPKTADYLTISVFNDQTTLQTLTRKIYYRVIAYDKNRNPSVASDILALTRPDRIAPVAPAIKSYTASDTAITITWTPSSSEDVDHQLLLRRDGDSPRWTELKKAAKQQTTFTDTDVKPGIDYAYALIAVDSAGLRSERSFPLNTRTLRASPKSISNLTVTVDSQQKRTSLAWSYPRNDVQFIVYRSLASAGLRSYEAVHRQTTYADTRVAAGQYEYAVRVIYPDGTQSGLSNRVKIEVK
ncbi:fibronectin type III domain-containing protein [Spirosoma pomorum]